MRSRLVTIVLFLLPGPGPVRSSIPTGAGDAFAGGLVEALARSWPDRLGMEEAMASGAAFGALAVEGFSVDRLLGATSEGVASRAREVRVSVRMHRPGPN